MIRAFAFALAALCSTAFAADKPAFSEEDAIKAVASGMCGSLPVGTGLVSGKGWLHQPVPGLVTVTLSGRGTVSTIGELPSAFVKLDMYGGRLSYIVVNAPSTSKLLWKVPGFEWGAVPVGFQLPPKKGAL